MGNYFKKRFYPQHFIMLKTANTDSIIEELSNEAANLAPDCFDAEVLYFNFILHYQPPYSEFKELKRLQSESIYNTRFKDEYHGFIAIDISEWSNHFDDEYFMIALTFLNDMSNSWKYIFLIDDENALKCASQSLEQFVPALRVFNINNSNSHEIIFSEKLIDELNNTFNIVLTPAAKILLRSVFNVNTHKKDAVANYAKDIASYFCKETKITESLLIEYLSDKLTYMNAHMTLEETMKLNDYILGSEVKR